MVNAIGFDLDGTLFDDRQYVQAGLEAAAERIRDLYDTDVRDDLFEAYFERDIEDRTFDVVLEECGLPADLVPTLVEAYHDTDGPLEPYPETEQVLDRLASEYRLGLLTGGTNGRSKLERLGLEDYFDATIVAPRHDLTKRQPEPFRMLLEALDASVEETVYVGDRPELDFVHPNALGMTTIQLVGGVHADGPGRDGSAPDHVIERLDELPALVASL